MRPVERGSRRIKRPSKNQGTRNYVRKLVVGTPTMVIKDAARLMLKCNVKKLPIVVDNRIVSLITLTDIAHVARI